MTDPHSIDSGEDCEIDRDPFSRRTVPAVGANPVNTIAPVDVFDLVGYMDRVERRRVEFLNRKRPGRKPKPGP